MFPVDAIAMSHQRKCFVLVSVTFGTRAFTLRQGTRLIGKHNEFTRDLAREVQVPSESTEAILTYHISTN